MIMLKRIAAMLACTAALSACGGSGAVNRITNAAPSLGGIWRGEMATPSGQTEPGVIVVTEDGKIFAAAQNADSSCTDALLGSLNLSANTFSGGADFGVIDYTTDIGVQIDCAFTDGSVSGTSILSGSVVSRASLTLISSDTTSLGTALTPTTGTFTFDDLYNEGSSLSKLAGNWTLLTGAVLNINADGVMFSQDSVNGCVLNGKVSLINVKYNAYSMSASYSNCGASASTLNGLTGTGLITRDDTVVPNVLYAGYSLTLPNGQVLVIASYATD
jgi:hypothetical protein